MQGCPTRESTRAQSARVRELSDASALWISTSLRSYKALSATVAARDISWKAVSEQTGVSQSTLSRMSRGRQPDAASLTALSAWSGINPVDFTTAPKNDPEAVAMVSRLLRADPNLDEDSADALEAIITTAYERLKRPSLDS